MIDEMAGNEGGKHDPGDDMCPVPCSRIHHAHRDDPYWLDPAFRLRLWLDYSAAASQNSVIGGRDTIECSSREHAWSFRHHSIVCDFC
jgi:hypothetical protein